LNILGVVNRTVTIVKKLRNGKGSSMENMIIGGDADQIERNGKDGEYIIQIWMTKLKINMHACCQD